MGGGGLMGGLLGLIFGIGAVMALLEARPRARQAHRRTPVVVPWPQFIDDVASGVRAGVAVPVAVFEAGSRLPNGARQLFDHWRLQWESGIGFEQSLRGLRVALDCAPFDQFSDTMDIAHRHGGRAVATLLSQLARNVRAQEQLIHEVRGRQAVTVTSAKVAVGAPWVVLVLTCVRPEVRSSYLSALGITVLVVVAATCGLCYFAMRRLAEISEMQVMR